MALKPTPSCRSTLTNHVFPCLYVCYLLRSKKGGTFSNRTYIGSSPDPPRRIRQHNGDLKTGGARKTMMFRPWEMEINVYGFPSKLLALQFEWAWQSPWLSRHLRNENGESYFKKAAGANHFQHKIAVLQRMLDSNPWNGLGLRVRLYSQHAKEVWEEAQRNGPLSRGPPTGRGPKRKTSHEVLASGSQWPDMSKVETVMRVEGVDGARMTREEPKKYGEDARIARIETDDRTWAVEQWEKWKTVEEKKQRCACCNKAIDTTDHLSFTFCPTSGCTSTSHIPCLAERYITLESLLPTAGPCPTCKTLTNWSQLIRGSFRRKDASEGKYDMKRRKNAKAIAAGEEEDEDMSDKSDEDSEPVEPKKRVSKAKTSRKRASNTAAKVKEDEEMSQQTAEEESEPVKPKKRATTKSKSRSYSSISSLDSEDDPERSIAFDAAAQGSFDAGCLFLPGEDDGYLTPEVSDGDVAEPTSVGSLGISAVQL